MQYFGDEEETPEMRQLTKLKFSKLAGLVDGASDTVGKEQWSVNGPKLVALKKLADGSALHSLQTKFVVLLPLWVEADTRGLYRASGKRIFSRLTYHQTLLIACYLNVKTR